MIKQYGMTVHSSDIFDVHLSNYPDAQECSDCSSEFVFKLLCFAWCVYTFLHVFWCWKIISSTLWWVSSSWCLRMWDLILTIFQFEAVRSFSSTILGEALVAGKNECLNDSQLAQTWADLNLWLALIQLSAADLNTSNFVSNFIKKN